MEEVLRHNLLPTFLSTRVTTLFSHLLNSCDHLTLTSKINFYPPGGAAWSSKITNWVLRTKVSHRVSHVAGGREHEWTVCKSNLAQRKVVDSIPEVFCLFVFYVYIMFILWLAWGLHFLKSYIKCCQKHDNVRGPLDLSLFEIKTNWIAVIQHKNTQTNTQTCLWDLHIRALEAEQIRQGR